MKTKFEVGRTYTIKDNNYNKKDTKKVKFLKTYKNFYLFCHKGGYVECFLKNTEDVLWEVVV